MASVEIANVLKSYAGHAGAARRLGQDSRRPVRRAGRSVGLRQVHAAAHDRRTGGHFGRHDQHRRQGRQRPAAEEARHLHGVPELCALPAYDGRRKHGVLDDACQSAQGRKGRARGEGRGNPRPDAAARSLSAPAVGRPAAARRHGPLDRAQPAGVPVRRTAVEPRRQIARGDARRDQGAASAPAHHHRLCHARPGRSHDDGRPDRRVERWAGGADRQRRSIFTTIRPICSSRPSSVRRR